MKAQEAVVTTDTTRVIAAHAGWSALELLLVSALAVTMTGVTIPLLATGIDEMRAAAAARYLASQMHKVRMEAVKRAASVALRFETDAQGFKFTCYLDGNGNGVRSADIAQGSDPPCGAAERIETRFPGAAFGIASTIPDVSGTGQLAAGSDPVLFGASDILSFTPIGTASSGTAYIRSASGRQFAVRVFGVTGRTRLLEFNAVAGQWITR